MDMENIDYHLKQAAAHLELALTESKTLLQNEKTEKAIADKWGDFLTYLFGNNEKIRGIY